MGAARLDSVHPTKQRMLDPQKSATSACIIRQEEMGPGDGDGFLAVFLPGADMHIGNSAPQPGHAAFRIGVSEKTGPQVIDGEIDCLGYACPGAKTWSGTRKPVLCMVAPSSP